MASTTDDADLLQAIKTANTAARDIMKHRDRASWLMVGQGLYAIRNEALSIAGTDSVRSNDYRNAQRKLMEGAPHLAVLVKRDHAGCQHAVWMYENWDELKEWIDGLPPTESVRLNHPTSINRRYNRAEPTWDEPRPRRIEDVGDLVREYPELVEQLAKGVRDEFKAKTQRDRTQGLMTRDTYDRLVACLQNPDPEAAQEMLEVLKELEWMLVREGEDIKQPELV